MKKRNNKSQTDPSLDVKETGSQDFEVNPFYENLLEMKDRKPAAFKNLSPATRFAVEAYLKAKRSLPAQRLIGERAA
jgi:hypothetical protein